MYQRQVVRKVNRLNHSHSFILIGKTIPISTRVNKKSKIYRPLDTECALSYDEWLDYQIRLGLRPATK